MRRKIIVICVILALVSTVTIIPTVIALSDEEVEDIVEEYTGEDMLLVYKEDYQGGYDYLFTNVTGEEPFIEAIVNGQDCDLSELEPESIENETLDEYIFEEYEAEYNYSVAEAVQGGENKTVTLELVTGTVTVLYRMVWVAGRNRFGVVLFKLYNRGIFFVEYGVKVFYIIDLCKTWHNSFWYERTGFTHEKDFIGSSGIITAEASFKQRWFPLEEWQLWSWQIINKYCQWTYDYGMEKL